MVTRVRGRTPEEREQSRANRALERLAGMCADRMGQAGTPRQRLVVACEYVRGAATHLPPEVADEWARDIAALVEARRT